MASEIVERAGGTERLLLVGIHTGGAHLSERLKMMIADAEGDEPAAGTVDITLYRDDAFYGLPKPLLGETRIPGGSLQGRTVVLVDDVLYTGRTVRAALDALMDFGRPDRILLAVAVDRGLRELPIQPDIAGLRISTAPEHQVRLELSESGGGDEAVLYRYEPDPAPAGAPGVPA